MIVERLAGGVRRWMLATRLARRDGVRLRVCVCASSAPLAHSNQKRGEKNWKRNLLLFFLNAGGRQ